MGMCLFEVLWNKIKWVKGELPIDRVRIDVQG